MTKGGTSHNYRIASEDPQKMRTVELAATLGVSESWVRNHVPSYEWHHCYGKYGDYAKAWFYTLPEVAEHLLSPECTKEMAFLAKRNPDAAMILRKWIEDAVPTRPLLEPMSEFEREYAEYAESMENEEDDEEDEALAH